MKKKQKPLKSENDLFWLNGGRTTTSARELVSTADICIGAHCTIRQDYRSGHWILVYFTHKKDKKMVITGQNREALIRLAADTGFLTLDEGENWTPERNVWQAYLNGPRKIRAVRVVRVGKQHVGLVQFQ